jgi:hypothetical protein
LPEPTFHYLLEVDGVVVAELDLAYPEQKVAIEVDGYGVHLRSQAIFENDRRRQNELEILGWAVLRFTRHALRDRPDRVADQVRRLLRARTPEPPQTLLLCARRAPATQQQRMLRVFWAAVLAGRGELSGR